MSDLPNPDTITRQSGAMGRVATDPNEVITPEQAVAEANAAREAAEQTAARERTSAESAARERDAALASAHTANAGALSAREQAIETAIAAHTSMAEQAKAALAAAQTNGDNMGVVEAIDRLTEARGTLRDLSNQKAYYADQKTRQPAEQQRGPSGDRVRTPGGEMVVTQHAKQWMDGHARFYSDPSYYNHAVAAHSTIVADGISEGSPAYFRELDKRMEDFEKFEAYQRGDHQPNQRTEPTVNTQRSQTRASSMGAPVSRATQPIQNNNGVPDPLAIARRLGAGLTVDDLREAARFAGYTPQRGFASQEAGFQQYLKDQEEIYQLERSGQPTGLVSDTVYR